MHAERDLSGTSARPAAFISMFKMFLLTAFMTVGSMPTHAAQKLSADVINEADVRLVPAERTKSEKPSPDPAIIRLQVMLDRAGASPGVIDGFDGSNFRKAISGYQMILHLPGNGRPSAELIARLADDAPVVGPYVITAVDAADIVPAIPEDYAEQAKMRHLGFTSVAEKLAERFHMDIELLQKLNPDAAFRQGETINVANPGAALAGKVKHIDVHRQKGQLVAFDKDDTILAIYPATIGSEETPSPSGRHKIKGVAHNPTYIYNPKVNFQQGNNTEKLTLPSGPNNPVGSVWIDLSKPTYGIHGTPEPSQIDKAGSHGCVRLTNWDAEELAAMVKPGVVVEFK